MADEQTTGTDRMQAETMTGAIGVALLNLVPMEKRPRAIELLMQFGSEIGKKELEAESRGYRDGKTETADVARREGFDEGWAACAQEIAGTKISADRALAAAMTSTVPSC